MNIPDGFSRLTPYFFVEDALEYFEHLKAALDAKSGPMTMRDGMLANGILHFGGASLMVSEAGRGFPPSKASTYLYVDDADAAMTRALANGMDKVMDVADMSYGDRQGGVKDKAGNLWWLSQRLVDEPY